MTNCPTLAAVRRRCYEAPPHQHRAAWGTTEQGTKRAREAGAYPIEMAMILARGVRSAYVKGLVVEKQKLPSLPLDLLKSHLGASTDELLKPVRARPTEIGGASSSSAAAPPQPAVEAPPAPVNTARDYWVQKSATWERHHIAPRNCYFSPTEVEGGPKPEDLTKDRETHIKFVDKTTDARKHDWTDDAWKIKRLPKKWTGISISLKKGAIATF